MYFRISERQEDGSYKYLPLDMAKIKAKQPCRAVAGVWLLRPDKQARKENLYEYPQHVDSQSQDRL
ncbi:protein of unknown function [Maridesulfovibrio hydrothermalis AM13 = DSM 14728]|uniref:Uncharacterized protein n=1 Tax=Maridesulfovibrio hydrothermalis AM13 = DSM 14728 TaxID=1121451 RepID=L0R7L0_9BACT|nr:protein of unknown function [Maridesulfovibrio hydrothermalis AM13 = DSM 14728]